MTTTDEFVRVPWSYVVVGSPQPRVWPARAPTGAAENRTRDTEETEMRTLISTAFISLDGGREAPGGEPGYRNSGWTFKDVEFLPEAFEIKGREQTEATAM